MSSVCKTCGAAVPAVAAAAAAAAAPRGRWSLLVRRASWRNWLAAVEDASENFDYNYSYNVAKFPAAVQSALITNDCDAGTSLFLQRCAERHRSLCAMLIDQLSLFLLKPFFSTTSVNALAFRGRMHVLSTAQFRQHLRLPDNAKLSKVLDIGAGDGHVTDQLAPLAETVHVTETNPFMRLRLALRRYEVFGRTNWQRNGPTYDVVTCLNVLDRCEDPVGLMQAMLNSLRPGGKLLIALALPYNPFIDEGKRGRRPSRPLPITGRNFADAAASFVTKVADALDLEVVSLSKAPYLCEGDSMRPYYVIDDMVVVLRRRNESTSYEGSEAGEDHDAFTVSA